MRTGKREIECVIRVAHRFAACTGTPQPSMARADGRASTMVSSAHDNIKAAAVRILSGLDLQPASGIL